MFQQVIVNERCETSDRTGMPAEEAEDFVAAVRSHPCCIGVGIVDRFLLGEDELAIVSHVFRFSRPNFGEQRLPKAAAKSLLKRGSAEEAPEGDSE